MDRRYRSVVARLVCPNCRWMMIHTPIPVDCGSVASPNDPSSFHVGNHDCERQKTARQFHIALLGGVPMALGLLIGLLWRPTVHSRITEPSP
jgi:hypothetical protein